MTLLDMKKKVLALMEELAPREGQAVGPLTQDGDLAAKLADVIGQVMLELVRIKKLPRLLLLPVTEGQLVDFEDLQTALGCQVHQLLAVGGAKHRLLAAGTVIQALETGTLQLELYVYPAPVTADTADEHTLELPRDLLEILPYGVAADLLKSDISANFGQVYAQRYRELLQRLDPRWSLPGITIEGGAAF